ncbi:AraC family transcriptional regulator [Emticicia aquatilis]|uniref:AraC family transcriptional regulator n=1 Tax=Emticicia aquatilis TaxID=1537369 RepID=A0A916Z5Q1_9BACT|nr:AraC family transcriptional regulator [Emticicia aquatilis]GGD77330.1 AraC family transcriptional regulator [Emticicia aquatilis]
MKVEYEKISPDTGSSFRLIHWKSENDRYFWHYHPEYEIVFVRKGSGKLHIGEHLKNYEEGELVFIGPDLPHTGFGYGVIGEHEEIVVQLRKDFLGEEFMQKPELQHIRELFERAKQGLSFQGKARKIVAAKLQKMLTLSHFERLVELLNIFHTLATTNEFSVLNAAEKRFDFNHKDEDRINRVYEYVEQNYQKSIDIQAVADLANLTVPSFCRYFKKISHITYTDFVNEYRINQACRLLFENKPIADICFEVGFNNISHFNKTFKQLKGVSPREYKANSNQ